MRRFNEVSSVIHEDERNSSKLTHQKRTYPFKLHAFIFLNHPNEKPKKILRIKGKVRPRKREGLTKKRNTML